MRTTLGIVGAALVIALAGCAAPAAPPEAAPPPAPNWNQQLLEYDMPNNASNEPAAIAAVRDYMGEEQNWLAVVSNLSDPGILNIAYTSCTVGNSTNSAAEARRAVMAMVRPEERDIDAYERIRNLAGAELCGTHIPG